MAHSHGVLHRDIKPANILLNQYGRPYLADFSLSFQSEKIEAGSDVLFGGTLAYMAPEHLEAFNPSLPAGPDQVDERSDLYSLSIVLFELLTGKIAFEPKRKEGNREEELEALTETRKKGLPTLPSYLQSQELEVHRSLDRAADGDPRRRYQTSLEFAQSLEGGIISRAAQQKISQRKLVDSVGQRKSLSRLFLLAVLPHLFGSVVNISYNAIRITGDLAEPQKEAFFHLVMIYNSIVYPICLGLLIWLVHRLMKINRSLSHTDDFVAIRGRSARSQVLLLPKRAALLACLGWLPGAFFFPLGIDMISGSINPEIYIHFGISFTISGLIALTYSFLGLACLTMGSLYPRMWPEPGEFPQRVGEELKSQTAWLSFFKILAV